VRNQNEDAECPVYRLSVDGTLLGDDLLSALQPFSLHRTFDGASQLTLSFDCVDPDTMDYRIVNEAMFLPGAEVSLWAGYGGTLMHQGYFRIKSRLPKYRPDGVTMDVEAFDALDEFIADQNGRLVQGVSTHADAIKEVLDRDYPQMGYLLMPSKAKKGDRFKEVLTSDLLWLKHMAIADGYAYPQVWSDEQLMVIEADARERLGDEPFAGCHRKQRRNNLVYLPLSTAYGLIEPVTLWYSLKGESDWESGPDIVESTSGMPTALEVYGWSNRLGTRALVRAIVEYASGVPRLVEITDDWQGDKWAREQGIKAEIKSGAALKFYALGEGTQDVESGKNKTRNQKGVLVAGEAHRAAREVLSAGALVHTEEDVVDFAMRWFLQRAAGYLGGQGAISNVPGAELFGPNQIHRIRGVVPQHEGLYVWKTASHTWGEDRHEVQMSFQKLVEEKDLTTNGAAPTKQIREVA